VKAAVPALWETAFAENLKRLLHVHRSTCLLSADAIFVGSSLELQNSLWSLFHAARPVRRRLHACNTRTLDAPAIKAQLCGPGSRRIRSRGAQPGSNQVSVSCPTAWFCQYASVQRLLQHAHMLAAGWRVQSWCLFCQGCHWEIFLFVTYFWGRTSCQAVPQTSRSPLLSVARLTHTHGCDFRSIQEQVLSRCSSIPVSSTSTFQPSSIVLQDTTMLRPLPASPTS
jgi:hypothetical protein